LGVKQRSCKTTIVILRFPIIIILPWESMAARRTPWPKVVKFGTLIQDSPMNPHSKFVVASSWSLAPATGQICTYIHVYNFWPIHPIFKIKVSLESLFNLCHHFAPWWIFHHLGLCQKPSKCISYHKFCSIISKRGTDDGQIMGHKKRRIDFSYSKLFGHDSQSNSSRRCQTGSKPISQPHIITKRGT
jgi:hypothetical protein